MSMIGIAIDLVSMAAMFAAGALAGRLWERGLKEPMPQSLMPRQIPMPVLHEPRKLVNPSPYAPKRPSHRLAAEINKKTRWDQLNNKIDTMPMKGPSQGNKQKARNLPSIDWGS